MNHRFDRVPHKYRRVIDHGIIDALGEIFLQLFHGAADMLGEVERVGAGRLEDWQGDSGFVVQERA